MYKRSATKKIGIFEQGTSIIQVPYADSGSFETEVCLPNYAASNPFFEVSAAGLWHESDDSRVTHVFGITFIRRVYTFFFFSSSVILAI